VRDVLSFARETRLELQPTTSTELFEATLNSCTALINGHRVAVTLETEPRLNLHADAGRMMQAIGNVVRNAIEAMVEHSPHTRAPHRLRLCARKRRWRDAAGVSMPIIALCVQDSGPGIPAEVRERIFNPFFTTRTTGTGLGLAIVHRIVDAHGGHINIDDASPSGAIVELCLPAMPPKSNSRHRDARM
jgi:signal transduction histidine kinase